MTKDKKKPKPQPKKMTDQQSRVNILDQVFKPQPAQTSNLSEAENVSLIIKEWLKPDHIRRKTRYTKRQVMAVSTLQSLADTYNITTLKRFLDEFRTNKLSEDGKSSQELENILKSRLPQMEETQLEKLGKYLE